MGKGWKTRNNLNNNEISELPPESYIQLNNTGNWIIEIIFVSYPAKQKRGGLFEIQRETVMHLGLNEEIIERSLADDMIR